MIETLVSRFAGLEDKDRIRELITVHPEVLENIDTMSDTSAAESFFLTLNDIYVPNSFAVDFIAEFVGYARSFSERHFSTDRDYSANVCSPPDRESIPLCLNGLAGVGKSGLIKALRKVLPGPVQFTSTIFVGSHTSNSYYYESAKMKAGGRQMLLNFMSAGSSSNESAPKAPRNANQLLVECRKQAYRNGTAATLLDEIQFAHAGEGTAKITDLLITASGLGLPMVYAANFSLLHQLFRRSQQDTDRLLAEPRIMVPDMLDSEPWVEYISECIRVSAGVIAIPHEELSLALFRSTVGIKRYVLYLLRGALLEARRSGRHRITINDIRAAENSPRYQKFKENVEALKRIAIDKKSIGRTDLTCPFDVPLEYITNVAKFSRSERNSRVIRNTIDSSLSAGERKALESHQAQPQKVATADQPKPSKPLKGDKVEMLARYARRLDAKSSKPKP